MDSYSRSRGCATKSEGHVVIGYVRLSGQVTGTGVYKEDMGGQVRGMNGFVGGMGSYSKRKGWPC